MNGAIEQHTCKQCDAPMVKDAVLGSDTWWCCPICKQALLVRVLLAAVRSVVVKGTVSV